MKFEILVLEAWDYAHWNLVDHRAWIYVPHLIPVLVILQNCKLKFAKISQKFQILHLETWDYAHWNLVEHCAWIYVPHLISAVFAPIYSGRAPLVQISIGNSAKTKNSRYQVWHINPGTILNRIPMSIVPGL